MVNQWNWVSLFNIEQFAYNLQQSSTTKKTPFELVLGQPPLTPIDMVQRTEGECLAAYKVARECTKVLQEAHDSLEHAARRMQHYVN